MNIYALVCGEAVETDNQQNLVQERKKQNAFSVILKTGICWDESIQYCSC